MSNGKIIIDSSLENLKNKYLTKKILEIKTKGDKNPDCIKDLKILATEDSTVRAEIDISKKGVEYIFHQLNLSEIIDFTISNTPLESIISEIYSSKGKCN
jgi:ABC-type uncharacterized transport system ATPase subunit